MLKDHVLNRLMTGRCPHTSLQLRPKFHSIFLQNSLDFQKVLHLKHVPRMYTDVSFNPANGAFSRMEKWSETVRVTDKVTTVTLSCALRVNGQIHLSTAKRFWSY